MAVLLKTNKGHMLQGQKYKPTSPETSQMFCVPVLVYSFKERALPQSAKILIIHTKWQLKGNIEHSWREPLTITIIITRSQIYCPACR